ncbi:MAG: PilZ domain-containing protein [Enhydrobacter sp.]|jgi:hypothetical protein|nr:PilZ domain-containing protein [Rhizobiaceae bacterium]UYN96445.1 MAG: PilZ domain-containing protein [Enhydrobacter sp.]
MNRSNENLDAAATPAEERRDAPRRRTLFSGKIIFNQQSSVFNCIVRNISDAGACLEIDSPVGIPDQFELLVEDAGIKADYRVIWRRGKRIGVTRV